MFLKSIALNYCDVNIDQNSQDSDFCHDGAALSTGVSFAVVFCTQMADGNIHIVKRRLNCALDKASDNLTRSG